MEPLLHSISRRSAFFLLTLLLLLAGCGELGPPPKKNYAMYHTVRTGETLYSIAFRYGYDYREVAAWNRIGPPYRIYAGQRLLVAPPPRGTAPVAGSPTARSTPSPSTKAPTQRTTAVPPATRPAPTSPSANTAARAVENKASSPHQGSVRWQWPTAGRVKHDYTNTASKKGINIAGVLGQSVYAAAAGDVVYSGSGLVGYGNLVIIKHDDVFLSAYGHNRRLLVKEGEKVKAGQIIAEMGETAKDGAMLHFEIRQEGKPVDPVRYLPKHNR